VEVIVAGEHEIKLTDAGETRGLDLGETLITRHAEEIRDGGFELIGGGVHAADAGGTLDDAGSRQFTEQGLLFGDGEVQTLRFERFALIELGIEAGFDAGSGWTGEPGGIEGSLQESAASLEAHLAQRLGGSRLAAFSSPGGGLGGEQSLGFGFFITLRQAQDGAGRETLQLEDFITRLEIFIFDLEDLAITADDLFHVLFS